MTNMMQTNEIRDELLSKGLHLPECMNYDRETLAEIKWIHTGEITPPFINWYRVNILALEPVDESIIDDVIKKMESKNEAFTTQKKRTPDEVVTAYLKKLTKAKEEFASSAEFVAKVEVNKEIKIGRNSIWKYLSRFFRNDLT